MLFRPDPHEKDCQLKLNERTTKLDAAEGDLEQLMADVSRVMEKAQKAVARLTSTVTVPNADIESATQ